MTLIIYTGTFYSVEYLWRRETYVDMEATKLEKLLIQEISAVDDPANEIPGFMVAKSVILGRAIGPDQAWDATSAEKRVRKVTGANDAPNATYASGFLHFDGAAPDEFGSYKFLVVDAVDGELKIMPQAVRTAISRLPDSDLSDTAKASVGSTLDALKVKAGIAEAQAATLTGEPQSIAEKVRSWLFPAGKDDIEMTSEELTAALDARDEALVEKFAEAVAKSVAPAGAPEGDELTPADEVPAPAAAPVVEAEVVAPLTAEDIAKAIQEALAPYSEILEKTLDRTERVEIALGIAARKSLEGQEGGDKPEDTPTPTVKDAIGVALRNRTVAVARR